MLQAMTVVINANLSVVVITAAIVLAAACGFLCGRFGRRDYAKVMVQDALDRGARHIRLFSEHGTGAAGNEFGRRALTEAEYILRWRSLGDNHLTKPDGSSRLRPPDVPRSQHFRVDRRRAEILRLAFNARHPDDTYAGSPRNQMAARYNTGPVVRKHKEAAS